ncbi:unnamed protein product (macronuclear) [Paramecium tetraurelia]|uniref:Uncharacterized protein n=1 Tax=Paramecium tetraurelia TaxID=5888 RepID=A0BUR0_PARTE|nr:uncharacterized protein GSPATT00005523001 [Paramecium tetraurelia]CAK62277.1 unnamed protein product [Paramecium tetraurelia]|eukprot:XP_001429675.1 hypothetical protein (macronuclear) [Paramecium tetraurelia strain d4-2]
MNQESIDESLERFRRDRQNIREKMAERNQLYEKAAQNYLSSLQREVETIKRTRPLAETRNQEFREQIVNLFQRYEDGSLRLKQAIQKTNIEKINYNNYLIKVYPNYFTDEKRKLKEENQRLMQQLQGFRQQVSNVPLQEIQNIQNEQYDYNELQRVDEYLGQDYQEQDFQNQQYHIQEQQRQQFQQPQGLQNYQNQSKQNLTKQQEQDFLSEFLIPQQGKK